jgi:hypothetical protein
MGGRKFNNRKTTLCTVSARAEPEMEHGPGHVNQFRAANAMAEVTWAWSKRAVYHGYDRRAIGGRKSSRLFSISSISAVVNSRIPS